MDFGGDIEGTLLLIFGFFGFVLMGGAFLVKSDDTGLWQPVFAVGCGLCVVSTICYLV